MYIKREGEREERSEYTYIAVHKWKVVEAFVYI